MITLLLLSGCLSVPDSIPNQAGQVTADAAPELMSVATPDLVYMLTTTARSLAGEDFRTCPEITTNDSTVIATADGCYDSAQITWSGTMSYRTDTLSETITFKDFSVVGTDGDWTVTGSIGVTYPDSRSAEVIVAKLALTSGGETPKEFWVDTTGTYTGSGSDFFYADTWSGEIGMEGWGLANVSGVRTYVGFVNACVYGAAGAGAVVVESDAGRGDFRFHIDRSFEDSSEDAATLRMPPPPISSTYDTGSTFDTGDSGTTGDTGTTGTGTTTPTDTSTTTDDSDASACGCAAVVLDGSATPVIECAVPSRVFAYPFIPVD